MEFRELGDILGEYPKQILDHRLTRGILVGTLLFAVACNPFTNPVEQQTVPPPPENPALTPPIPNIPPLRDFERRIATQRIHDLKETLEEYMNKDLARSYFSRSGIDVVDMMTDRRIVEFIRANSPYRNFPTQDLGKFNNIIWYIPIIDNNPSFSIQNRYDFGKITATKISGLVVLGPSPNNQNFSSHGVRDLETALSFIEQLYQIPAGLSDHTLVQVSSVGSADMNARVFGHIRPDLTVMRILIADDGSSVLDAIKPTAYPFRG